MKTVFVLACLLVAAMTANATKSSLLETLMNEVQDVDDEAAMKADDEPGTIQWGRPSSDKREEIMAQAMCQFSASTEGEGRVYAVARTCSSSSATCDKICTDKRLTNQDFQTKNNKWSCVAAYHVYYHRSSSQPGNLGSTRLGFKSAKTKCDTTYCGPNYCCCFAALGSGIE